MRGRFRRRWAGARTEHPQARERVTVAMSTHSRSFFAADRKASRACQLAYFINAVILSMITFGVA